MSADEVLPEWALAEVDPEKMKVLALLLADPNPLHFDPAVAPRLGVAERPVNQGPSNMAMLVNLLRAAYPRGRLRRLTVQLRAPRRRCAARSPSRWTEGGWSCRARPRSRSRSWLPADCCWTPVGLLVAVVEPDQTIVWCFVQEVCHG
jgi:hypothetical protein